VSVAVVAVAIVAVPGVSISSGVSHSISSRLGISGPLLLPVPATVVAIRPVVAAVSVATVAVVTVPGISISVRVGSSGGLWLSIC